MELLRPFSKINKSNVSIAGGKGASLGEMINSGIPVPDGFVVLSTTFDKFIEESDLNIELGSILDNVNHEEIHTVEDASEKIKNLILVAKMPKNIENEIKTSFKELGAKFVAVRSSATSEDSADAAWAGQLESYLNTTEKDLLENVKKCWASLFTPRAIFYRKEKNLHESKISVAVVVQKMVDSECSGIAFSVHPVTQDRNQIIIEAGFGLGEAVVSGSITPDSYVIEKTPRRIIDKNINTQERGLYKKANGGNEWKNISKEAGKKQVLSNKEILELSELVLKIEKHYGFPCDIEWAREGGKFYIVQSRPITTLTNEKDIAKQIILSKTNTRERSLFYIFAWSESDLKNSKKLWPDSVKNVVLLKNNFSSKFTSWYSEKELDNIYTKLEKRINKDKKYFELIKNKYLNGIKELSPYLEHKKEFNNINDLKKFYLRWLDWWHLVDFFMNVPELKNIPKDIRDETIKTREQTQHLPPLFNKTFTKFFTKKYPQYERYMNILLPNEVFSLQKNKFTKEQIRLFEERLNGCALINGKLFLRKDFNQELEKKNLVLKNEEEIEYSEIIKGNVAYPGKIKGIVHLISTAEDNSKIQEGEILVTEMTSPEFVSAVKKAAAIITDEGGITCHAAIIARELRKPCIIGTKIATNILKNGDFVEVDANTGIARIIKKFNRSL